MSDITQEYINQFFAAIDPFKDVYQKDSLSFFAVKSANEFILIHGTLFLNVREPTIPYDCFQSDNIRACHFLLSDAQLTREMVVEQLRGGKLDTPQGPVHFPSSSGLYGAQYLPYHADGLKNQARLTHLTLLGSDARTRFDREQLDWELRAAATPYDGLQDLLNQFQPGMLGNVCSLEIAAFSVAQIDFESTVDGETAKLGVRAAQTVNPAMLAVGYRILEQGRVLHRGRLDDASFHWSEKDGYKFGSAEFPVPRASIVHAIAIYNGIAQQHYFFGDPKSFQNPLRAAYEAADPKLAVINDILAKARNTRPDSRGFEIAMQGLCWMLGFAPAHVGGIPRTSDAVDFVLSAPNGHLCVVECTVGLLKEDHKLAELHKRAVLVRKNLDTSSTRHIRVLPVIITAKTQEEIRSELEAAERLGIYVITREEIERLLQRTLFPPIANQLYEAAEQEVAAALVRYDQQNLPGLITPG